VHVNFLQLNHHFAKEIIRVKNAAHGSSRSTALVCCVRLDEMTSVVKSEVLLYICIIEFE
jgi:hypothetical protein